MASMNDIFGSDSENESQKSANSNHEHAEDEAEEKQSNEESESKKASEQEEEDEVNDEDREKTPSNRSNQEDEDEDVIVKKASAQVFGDELDDLSESGDEAEEHEEREVEEQDDREENEPREDEEEEEEEEEPEKIINIEIPKVKSDLGKEVHFVKLPNFLSIEPKPFDHETYKEEKPKGEALDEEGKTRVRLKVENTIRWKYDKDSDGNIVKQSNARLVKWSDGSLSMHLGNEIFDVYQTPMQGDHNHLFVSQANTLLAQTIFKTKLSFRPHSIDSMTHRKMTMSLVEHGAKIKKVKMLTELEKNPEHNRLDMLKKAEEKLRADSRRQNQQRRLREKAHYKGLSSNYLEDRYQSEEEDPSAISLSAIKNKFKHGNRNDSKTSLYSSDESDRERRLTKAKSNEVEDVDDLNDDDDDDYGTNDNDDVDDDHDETKRKKSLKKKKVRKVVSDDEDE